MKIATGIKGIRKFLADNNSGWHVMIDDRYVAYVSMTVADVFETFDDMGLTFVGWAGNGVHFTTN